MSKRLMAIIGGSVAAVGVGAALVWRWVSGHQEDSEHLQAEKKLAEAKQKAGA